MVTGGSNCQFSSCLYILETLHRNESIYAQNPATALSHTCVPLHYLTRVCISHVCATALSHTCVRLTRVCHGTVSHVCASADILRTCTTTEPLILLNISL